MQIIDLKLKGLKLIAPQVWNDARGFFFEMYHSDRYANRGIFSSFVQDNCSFSNKGTVRGLHFQSEPGQAKLVSCLHGTIWDVAVDIRPESPTFGQWEAVTLDALHCHQLFIPVGLAHGFCVLSEGAILQYKVSSHYNPKTEQSIRWNDPDLAISWPITNPLLCERDKNSVLFKDLSFPNFWLDRPVLGETAARSPGEPDADVRRNREMSSQKFGKLK